MMVAAGVAVLQGFPPGTPGVPGIPFEAVLIAKSLFTAIVFIALGIPIVRALSKRFIERPPVTTLSVPPDITARLERIEQAVEAVAIEVERIAESQRFAAKLMAEQRALPRGGTPTGMQPPAGTLGQPDQSR